MRSKQSLAVLLVLVAAATVGLLALPDILTNAQHPAAPVPGGQQVQQQTPPANLDPATQQSAQPLRAESDEITGQGSTIAMLDDARLNDVFFVDPQVGWAVGDRGVIWATADGGATWQLQRSGVDCTLSPAIFLDRENDWIAGGTYDPFAKTSSAVILWTRDGGQTWRLEEGARLLPFARQVKFFNRNEGWLRTDPSAMHPSGLFHTEDGGRSWNPVLAAGGWQAADFLDPMNGAVAGMHGAVAGIRRQNVRVAAPLSVGMREVHEMQLVPGGGGWLVGDGGLVMLTGTGGNDWQFPNQRFDGRLAQLFDFQALCVIGTQAWLAGSPGSCVFHSPDAGNSWNVLQTGQTAPLRGLQFIDPMHGWAVGDLGTILATADGGRTWQVQHRGGTRAAVLGVFSDSEHVPWEAFSQIAAQEGFLSVAHAIGRRDLNASPLEFREDFARFHEAFVRMGGTSAEVDWQFPLDQDGVARATQHVLDTWDSANDDRGLSKLQERLVRLIRTWRPEVILTPEPGNPDDPAGELISNVIAQAALVAADERRFAEHQQIGLPPWQVKKILTVLPPGADGQINLETSTFAPRLQSSLADAAQSAYVLAAPLANNPLGPKKWGFRIAEDQTGSAAADRGIMGGITLSPGSEARRRLLEAPEESTAALEAAKKFRNATAILDQAEKSPELQARLMGQIGDLTAGMEGHLAGRMLYNLAASYHRTGRSSLGAQTYEVLFKRYPDHPLAPAAGVWLVQYYASAEMGHRTQLAEASGSYSGKSTLAIDPTRPGQAVINTASAIENLGNAVRAVDLREDTSRAEQATAFGNAIEHNSPQLAAEPRLQFPLAAAYVNRGLVNNAEKFFFQILQGSVDGAWRDCAAAENWLAQREGPAPKPMINCLRGQGKPHLDGELNDALWQQATPIRLRGKAHAEDEFGAVALTVTDGEFLYLGVHCPKDRSLTYEASPEVRQRDADLANFDRVEFLIDIDRDYATYYRLAVDSRGWTAESCFGDETWNPTWYVAATQDDADFWSAEMAIPLAELTPRLIPGSTVWALGVQRVIPGTGLESWTKPASTSVQPQGFGLLNFPQ